MSAPRLFPRPLGPHCDGCRLLSVCGSERTDNACASRLDLSGRGGPFALHPLRVDFDEHFARVGGATFDDVVARPSEKLDLGPHLPQVWWRARLRDERLSALDVPTVGVRLKEVFRGGRIRSAAELRAKVSLGDNTPVVLLLHGKDSLLERLAGDKALVGEIAVGGYTLVTPPSFSLWEPQRRPDNLLSLRRSFVYYGRLQEAGVHACVRLGWVEPLDAERLAEWVNRNGVEMVSLDLMTYQVRSFDRAVALLAYFDELTGRRLHYLIDGVRASHRIEALYMAAAPERITVSSATLAGPPPESSARLNAGSFMVRAAAIVARCASARRAVEAVEAAAAPSLDDVITTLGTEATSYGRETSTARAGVDSSQLAVVR